MWPFPIDSSIRHAAKSHINKAFLSPLFITDRAHELAVAIQRCGGNINQIARHLNTYHSATDADFRAALDQVSNLVNLVQGSLQHPQTLREIFEQGIATDPQFLEKILALYYEFLRTTRT